MRKYWVILLLSLATIFSGCTKYWYQKGKTFEECQQDRLDCFNELKQRSDLRGSADYDFKFMKECMEQKGYQLAPQDKLPLDVKRLNPDRTLHYRMKGIAGEIAKP